MEKDGNKIFLQVLLIFLLCSFVKNVEFLFIKTDQTILAENVVCKLFCILLVTVILRTRGMVWRDLGFQRNGLLKGLVCGLLLGSSTFLLSWIVEFLILSAMSRHPQLSLFITNFAISGQHINKLSLAAVLICIIGNIFNVWAEEGLFRGLFLHLLSQKNTFRKSNVIQALLFGVWHVITVIVWVKDGMLTIPAALIMAVGYIALAGILGYEWGLCVSLTGTVWTGVFEHFFNNFIGNVLHTVTETGIDELQILRIILSNFLSLAFVLLWSRRRNRIR